MGLVVSLGIMCKLHNITAGQVEMGLDGKEVMNQVFATKDPTPELVVHLGTTAGPILGNNNSVSFGSITKNSATTRTITLANEGTSVCDSTYSLVDCFSGTIYFSNKVI